MQYTRGFIALTSVLVISAIFLSISISITSRAISGSGMSVALYERDTAKYLAQACVEHAQQELLKTLNYIGEESVAVYDNSCDILTIEGIGNTDRIIKTESTFGDHTYRILVEIDEVSPHMIISSYERVASF